MLVNTRTTTEISRPTGEPENAFTKKRRTAGKNPRIGMDWSTSRTGSMTAPARGFVAAVVPYTIPNVSARRYAANIRAREKRARTPTSPALAAWGGNRRMTATATRSTAPATVHRRRREGPIQPGKGRGLLTGYRRAEDGRNRHVVVRTWRNGGRRRDLDEVEGCLSAGGGGFRHDGA